MGRIWIISLAIILIACAAHNTYSQNIPKWVDEVEQELKKEGWKAIRKTTYIDQKTKKFGNVTIQLLSNDIDATIDIKLQESTEQARSYFRSALTAYKVTKNEATVNKFKNLGNENLLVSRGKGWLGLTFRKGPVITDVLALSEETANTVARIIVTKIPN